MGGGKGPRPQGPSPEQIALQQAQMAAVARQQAQADAAEASSAASRRARGRSGRAVLITGNEQGVLAPAMPGTQPTLGG